MDFKSDGTKMRRHRKQAENNLCFFYENCLINDNFYVIIQYISWFYVIMYEILIFEDKKGHSTVKERISELRKKSSTDKKARIALNKILEYMSILERCGTRAGEKFTKHIKGDIWELRPLDNRIFFFYWGNKKIVLLHCFQKKSQKTPQREIEQAERNLYTFLEGERQ